MMTGTLYNVATARDLGCGGCRFLNIFKPRADEQARYGFGEVGYGCGHPFDGGVYVLNPAVRSCFKGNGYSPAQVPA